MRAQLLVGVMLLLAAPASATWYGPGGPEPDTDADVQGGRMFANATREAAERPVYFNGYLAVEGTSMSPNSATLGTRLLFPASHARAMLGVWLDCNGDDYVGHAESALQEYPALLADPLVCPVGSLHNDGQWVSEMIGIGMVDPCEHEPDPHVRARECPSGNPVEPVVGAFHANERVLYSSDTYVWADHGAPGTVPPRECVLLPMPRGTTSGAGPMLRYADCQAGDRVAPALAAADKDGAVLALLETPLPVTLLGAPDGRPGALQQGSGRSAATVFDCSSRAPVADPTGAPGQRGDASEIVLHDRTGRLTGPMFPLVLTGYTFKDEDANASTPGVMRIPLDADGRGTYAWVPNAAEPRVDATGSWWDAGEAAADAVRGDCDPRTRSALQTHWPGATLESGDHLVPAARKDQTSLTFTFYDGHRGLNANLDPHTGEATPSDGGLLLLRHGRGGAGPMWSATIGTTEEPQLLRRGDLGPSPAHYITYYARVGADVQQRERLVLPLATPAIYASEACEGSAPAPGWVCDASLWWRDAAGNDVTPRYARGERLGRLPGDPYDLRDVDCMDGALVPGEGVYASLVASHPEGPCA